MLSNDSSQPQASPLPDPKTAGAAQPPVMDPNSPIETASTGTGTTNDPVVTDTRPPFTEYSLPE